MRGLVRQWRTELGASARRWPAGAWAWLLARADWPGHARGAVRVCAELAGYAQELPGCAWKWSEVVRAWPRGAHRLRAVAGSARAGRTGCGWPSSGRTGAVLGVLWPCRRVLAKSEWQQNSRQWRLLVAVSKNYIKSNYFPTTIVCFKNKD